MIRFNNDIGQSTQVQQNSKPYSEKDMDIYLNDEEDDDDYDNDDDEEEIILQGRVQLSRSRNDSSGYSSDDDSEDDMFESVQKFLDERDTDTNADVDKEHQGEYTYSTSDVNHSNNSNNEKVGNGARLPRDATASSYTPVKYDCTTSYSTNTNTQ